MSLPSMPQKPVKPTLPERPAPSEASSKRTTALLTVGGVCVGFLFLFALNSALPMFALIALAPFLFAGLHYWLWGWRLSAWIHARVSSEEAAERAAEQASGRRPFRTDDQLSGEAVEDEPWLRGEERE